MQTQVEIPMTIELAKPADLLIILDLLTSQQLPLEGLEEHLATTFVARTEQEIIGCAALEPYGIAALLRSVAVKQTYQGQGLGQRLTQTVLDFARQQGITRMYLLTTTASTFFPRFGFRLINREDVPPEVQTSVEFTSACPKSAVVMEANLETT